MLIVFKGILSLVALLISRIWEGMLTSLCYYLLSEVMFCWTNEAGLDVSNFYCTDSYAYFMLPIGLGLGCFALAFVVRYGILTSSAMDITYFQELAEIRLNYGTKSMI